MALGARRIGAFIGRARADSVVLSRRKEACVTVPTDLISPLIADSAATPGPQARALVERDSAVFAPCAGRVYPFVIERGEGCYVWDVDGNRYLDLNAGIAVVSAGHSHPRLVRAIREQAGKLIHMGGTDFYNEPMIKTSEKLVALMPETRPGSRQSFPDWQVFLS